MGSLLDSEGKRIEYTDEQKLKLKITEKGLVPDARCSNCYGRGWVKRKIGGHNDFMIDFCGCLKKRDAE